jgi:predicted dehydrogenase
VTVRLLQVGLGGWGRYWLRRMVPQVPEVEHVGCVDLDPDALAEARRLGVPADRCFADLQTAMAATRPDAVLVTTTLLAHVPAARAALESGKHVLVEKPFAPALAEARELVELADSRGLVLMVSQNYRFFPAARAVRRLVRDGRLGALDEVEIDFRHRSAEPPGDGRRRGHRLLQQPLLMDMSIHHFDLLRTILGSEPERITCHAWNPAWSDFDGPPCAVATILFPGVVVSYRGTWLNAGADTPWAGEWRMTFEGGEVCWSSRDAFDSTDAERVVVRPRGGEPSRVALPAVPLLDQAGSLAEFVDAVRAGREPESSGRENLGSLALALAAVESADRGAAVDLPAFLSL